MDSDLSFWVSLILTVLQFSSPAAPRKRGRGKGGCQLSQRLSHQEVNEDLQRPYVSEWRIAFGF